jgi:predicted MPP superfamily phosphohydrolase
MATSARHLHDNAAWLPDLDFMRPVFRITRDEWLPKPIAAAVFIWHFILLPVAGILFLVKQAGALVGRARRVFLPSPTSDSPSRRDFLRTAAIATPPVLTVLATGVSLSQLNHFRIQRINLAIPQLPPALEGLTIAQVSDIHIGRFTSGDVLRNIVNATNNLRADLVILSGDLIDHSLADLPAGLDMVKRMDSRFGAFMCEGNHDLFENRVGFELAVKNSGVPLLVNESQMLNIRGQAVQLLGLRWGSLDRSFQREAGIAGSMNELISLREPDAFPILMAHHPHAFDAAADAGIPLTLSGHTHGGQLMLSKNVGIGPMMFKYWSGVYEKARSKLVVSNGVGNWFPLRINAPAEIVHITLHSAENIST